MLQQIFNPDIYHGFNKKDNFFEGWYFKVEDKVGTVYAFIPGVFVSNKKEESFSFIQIFLGNKTAIKFLRYPYDSFGSSKNSFKVAIDKNSFSISSMTLNIDDNNMKIHGALSFTNIKKWPDNLLNPGSMGFYNYLTFMECYSQVCAMTGDLEGKLLIEGETVDFNGGKIYIEKNWGKAFPHSYLWCQCNNFKNSNISISCSIGHIPMPVGSFTGFLIGMYVNNNFYKFTTINRSKLSMNFAENIINITAENHRLKLMLELYYNNDSFSILYAPKNGSMVPIARETLQGNIKLSLLDIKSGIPLVEDYGSCAGIEFSGDYQSFSQNPIHI